MKLATSSIFPSHHYIPLLSTGKAIVIPAIKVCADIIEEAI